MQNELEQNTDLCHQHVNTAITDINQSINKLTLTLACKRTALNVAYGQIFEFGRNDTPVATELLPHEPKLQLHALPWVYIGDANQKNELLSQEAVFKLLSGTINETAQARIPGRASANPFGSKLMVQIIVSPTLPPALRELQLRLNYRAWLGGVSIIPDGTFVIDSVLCPVYVRILKPASVSPN